MRKAVWTSPSRVFHQFTWFHIDTALIFSSEILHRSMAKTYVGHRALIEKKLTYLKTSQALKLTHPLAQYPCFWKFTLRKQTMERIVCTGIQLYVQDKQDIKYCNIWKQLKCPILSYANVNM